jgi:hypothetical protein
MTQALFLGDHLMNLQEDQNSMTYIESSQGYVVLEVMSQLLKREKFQMNSKIFVTS